MLRAWLAVVIDRTPCQPLLDEFKQTIPPIPGQCKTPKLKDQPSLFSDDLRFAAESWNKRDWGRWEVNPDGALEAELKKSTEFFVSELYASCDTPR